MKADGPDAGRGLQRRDGKRGLMLASPRTAPHNTNPCTERRVKCEEVVGVVVVVVVVACAEEFV